MDTLFAMLCLMANIIAVVQLVRMIIEYSHPRYYKQYRTLCNRRLRKMRDVCWGDGAGYRKATEFWWTVE